MRPNVALRPRMWQWHCSNYFQLFSCLATCHQSVRFEFIGLILRYEAVLSQHQSFGSSSRVVGEIIKVILLREMLRITKSQERGPGAVQDVGNEVY